MDIYFARPIHPGEMLREEFMVPLGLTAGKLARAIGVPRSRIERLAREETAMTVDTAMRLARYFRMSYEFWTGMQPLYEVNCLRNDKDFQAATDTIVPRPEREVRDEAA